MFIQLYLRFDLNSTKWAALGPSTLGSDGKTFRAVTIGKKLSADSSERGVLGTSTAYAFVSLGWVNGNGGLSLTPNRGKPLVPGRNVSGILDLRWKSFDHEQLLIEFGSPSTTDTIQRLAVKYVRSLP
ncbi:MAG: hypothetical protein M3N13_08885 [Candidatus Eremiobacteraeota bacterium]|nr:hypothetical protein [Candidatus Eremiobacteraeota bacterium]